MILFCLQNYESNKNDNVKFHQNDPVPTLLCKRWETCWIGDVQLTLGNKKNRGNGSVEDISLPISPGAGCKSSSNSSRDPTG